MKKYIVEFIGTFFLVLTIGMCVLQPDPAALPPLAIGAVLMVMVYAGGHISGAHYNPAVTLAVWLRGKCAAKDVPFYILAQLLGSTAASFAALYLKYQGVPHGNLGLIPAVFPVMLAEFLFTFALCYVVLNVATSDDTKGNSFYGLAIGFTVTAAAFAIGRMGGGALNPAVVLGLGLMKLIGWEWLWIHLIGEVAAAVVAALLFKYLQSKD